MTGGEPHTRPLQGWSELGATPRRGSLAPIEWLRNGRMPSLWFMARLLFALGVLSIVGEVLTAAALIVGTMGGLVSHFWAMALPSLITFSVTTALFLGFAAFAAYLAARNDREASEFHLPPDVPKEAPAP